MVAVVPTKAGSVSTLIDKHSTLINAASSPASSPSGSPTLSRSSTLLPPVSPSRTPSPSPASPSLAPSPLPPTLAPPQSREEDPSPSRSSAPPVSMSGSGTLGEIKEGAVVEQAASGGQGSESGGSDDLEDGQISESVLFPARAHTPPPPADGAEPQQAEAKDEVAPALKEALAEAAAMLPTPPPSAALPTATGDSPLAKILESLPALSVKEQATIQSNIERLGGYPRDLPLSASWTMYFSDTSRATKQSGATQEQYTTSLSPVFTAASVPTLCGSLKAYKRLVRSKRARPGDADTMGLAAFRPGQNLHFFREGVSPTWEDPWNEKGGRIIISPPLALIDACYERLVLLLAGSALEAATADIIASPDSGANRTGVPEGLIIGVVASRRARGDRIELWLGGKSPCEAAPAAWIEILKECIATELEMPEVRAGKFKRHF